MDLRCCCGGGGSLVVVVGFEVLEGLNNLFMLLFLGLVMLGVGNYLAVVVHGGGEGRNHERDCCCLEIKRKWA